MFIPVEAFIGWRYTRARRRTRFVSLISAIAIGGVALGIAALITILSIMNGFERELRDRLLGMSAHLTIDSPAGPLPNTAGPAALIGSAAQVVGVAPFITAEALLTIRAKCMACVSSGSSQPAKTRSLAWGRACGVAILTPCKRVVSTSC